MTLQAGSLRTYRSLNSWYAKFKAAGSNMKNMQHFSNQIHEALPKGNKDTTILSSLPCRRCTC